MTDFEELRFGGKYKNGIIELAAGRPLLFSVEVDTAFTDTYRHWAEDYITELENQGLVSGVSESKFCPEKKLTYAEWITLVVKYLGLDVPETDGSHWSSRYVAAAEKAGIISGNIDLDKEISRARMCEILVTALEKVKGVVLVSGNLTFKDSDECDSVTVSKAVNAGFISGYEDNTFRPNESLTRAEAARILSEKL